MYLHGCIITRAKFGDNSVESFDAFVAEKKAMIIGEEKAMDPAETIKVEPIVEDDDSCSNSSQSPVTMKKELPDYSSDGNETSLSRDGRKPNPISFSLVF